MAIAFRRIRGSLIARSQTASSVLAPQIVEERRVCGIGRDQRHPLSSAANPAQRRIPAASCRGSSIRTVRAYFDATRVAIKLSPTLISIPSPLGLPCQSFTAQPCTVSRSSEGSGQIHTLPKLRSPCSSSTEYQLRTARSCAAKGVLASY